MASASRFWPRPGLDLLVLLCNRATTSRPNRGQSFEAEAKILVLRPLWPPGLNITENGPVMLSPRGQSGLEAKILASALASKLWPRPRGFGLGLVSIFLSYYVIGQRYRREAEAKTSRPRPELRGRGRGQHFGLGLGLGLEALASASKFRPRPGLDLLVLLCNRATRWRPDRGQNFEAKAKVSRPRPKFWF